MTEDLLEPAVLAKLADVGYTPAYGSAIAKDGNAPKPLDQNQLEMHWAADGFPDFTDPEAANVTKTSGKTSEKASVKTSGKLLVLIRKNPEITTPEMALSIGVTERSIERNLKKLQEEQLLSRIGPAKGGH